MDFSGWLRLAVIGVIAVGAAGLVLRPKSFMPRKDGGGAPEDRSVGGGGTPENIHSGSDSYPSGSGDAGGGH
jgi:hypothetical protein